jgi:hypothetical protein
MQGLDLPAVSQGAAQKSSSTEEQQHRRAAAQKSSSTEEQQHRRAQKSSSQAAGQLCSTGSGRHMYVYRLAARHAVAWLLQHAASLAGLAQQCRLLA